VNDQVFVVGAKNSELVCSELNSESGLYNVLQSIRTAEYYWLVWQKIKELTQTFYGATFIPVPPKHLARLLNSAFTIMLRPVSGYITAKEAEGILENCDRWSRE
jgi:hypothetical protein